MFIFQGVHQRDQHGRQLDLADVGPVHPQLSHLQGHQREPGNNGPRMLIYLTLYQETEVHVSIVIYKVLYTLKRMYLKTNQNGICRRT